LEAISQAKSLCHPGDGVLVYVFGKYWTFAVVHEPAVRRKPEKFPRILTLNLEL
jgi:hypothetical protein